MDATVRTRLAHVCQETVSPIVSASRSSLGELGVDSLSTVTLLAGIYEEFGVHLCTDAPLAEYSFDQLAAILADRIRAEQRPQYMPTDEQMPARVPTLANRYSYFILKKRHLERWNIVSRLYRLVPPVNLAAFERAVEFVVERHDSLRLRLSMTESSVDQTIVTPSETRPLRILDLPTSNEARSHWINAEIRAEQEATSLSGDLFRVLLFRDAGRREYTFCVIAHHVLVDGFSFRIVMTDLANTYEHWWRGFQVDGPEPLPALSFNRYSSESIAFWVRHGPEKIGTWLARRWDCLGSLRPHLTPLDERNIEAHSAQVVSEFGVLIERRLQALAAKHRLEEIVLASIARAYRRWVGHAVIHLAFVVHGRTERGLSGSPARTVGWISETVPIVLPTDGDLRDLLEEVRTQLKEAQSSGRALGVLRYLSPLGSVASDAVQALPNAEISLNMDLGRPFVPRSGQHIERDESVSTVALIAPETQRVFLLSGGVFRREGALSIGWDYSASLFCRGEIERLTKLCCAELGAITEALEASR